MSRDIKSRLGALEAIRSGAPVVVVNDEPLPRARPPGGRILRVRTGVPRAGKWMQ